jgi:hypothetical protein
MTSLHSVTESTTDKMTKKLATSPSNANIEIEQPKSQGYSTYGVDVVFGLDVKKISMSETEFADQLLLVVKNVEPRVARSEIAVNSLTDLGVLKFTTDDPDPEDDVICFVQRNRDYWIATEQVQKIWEALLKELEQLESTWLHTPQVFKKRRIRYAITGTKYFNNFRAPHIIKMPYIYLSHETDIEAEDPEIKPKPLVLFDNSGI